MNLRIPSLNDEMIIQFKLFYNVLLKFRISIAGHPAKLMKMTENRSSWIDG